MLHIQLNNSLTFVAAQQSSDSVVYYYIDGHGNKFTVNRTLPYPCNISTLNIKRFNDEEQSVLLTYMYKSQLIIHKISYDGGIRGNAVPTIDSVITTIVGHDKIENLQYNTSEVFKCGNKRGDQAVHTAVVCVTYNDMVVKGIAATLVTIDVIPHRGMVVKKATYVFDNDTIPYNPTHVSIVAKTTSSGVTDGMVAILVDDPTANASSVIKLLPFSRKCTMSSKAAFIAVRDGYKDTTIPFELPDGCLDSKLVDFQLSDVFNGTISVLYKLKSDGVWRCRTYVNRSNALTAGRGIYYTKDCVLGDIALIGLTHTSFSSADKMVLLNSGVNIGIVSLTTNHKTLSRNISFYKFKVITNDYSDHIEPRAKMESVSILNISSDKGKCRYSTDIYTDEHGTTHISVLWYTKDSVDIVSASKFFVTANSEVRCEVQEHPLDVNEDVEDAEDTVKPAPMVNDRVQMPTREELLKMDIYARPGDKEKKMAHEVPEYTATTTEPSIDNDYIQFMVISAMLYKLHRDCPDYLTSDKYAVPLAILPCAHNGRKMWNAVVSDGSEPLLFETLSDVEGYVYEAAMNIRIDMLKEQMDTGSVHAENSLVALLDHMSGSLAASYSNWKKNRK